MTAVVIPELVIGLLGDEIKHVVKRVVTDLGEKYSFDRDEASEYLHNRYNFTDVMSLDDVKNSRKHKKKVDHPALTKVKETTRCRARTFVKGVYSQCTRCWISENVKLCGMHAGKKELKHGRIDDDKE
jgi:hypothetical protein